MSSLSEYEAMSCPVTPISGCMRPGRAGVSYDFVCDCAAVLLAFFSTAPFRGSSVLLFPFPCYLLLGARVYLESTASAGSTPASSTPKSQNVCRVFFSKALGKQRVYRVSESLPSVFSLALGKEMVCRVSDKIHSAKNITLGKAFDSGSF